MTTLPALRVHTNQLSVHMTTAGSNSGQKAREDADLRIETGHWETEVAEDVLQPWEAHMRPMMEAHKVTKLTEVSLSIAMC